VAFDPSVGFTDRFDMIRAHCAGLDEDELTDATIALPSYYLKETIQINSDYPDYDTMSADNQSLIKLGFTYLSAAKLCETYCKGRVFRLTDNKSQAELDKIDWDALAATLRGQADDVFPEIDEDVVPVSAGLVLAPSAYNPITGVSQGLIGS